MVSFNTPSLHHPTQNPIPNTKRLKRIYVEIHPEYQRFKDVSHRCQLDIPIDTEPMLLFAVDSVIASSDTDLWDLRHFCDFVYGYLDDMEESLTSVYGEDGGKEKLVILESELMQAYNESLLTLYPRLYPLARSVEMNEDGYPIWLSCQLQYPYAILEHYDR